MVYLLENEACQLVDVIFDKMHYFGHLKFIMAYIPFSFPVFVVWKTDIKGKRQGRVMVDIQKLNERMLPNTYPLPL